MAEEEEEEEQNTETLRSAFPIGRVKKIVKLDQDIKTVNSEAMSLIAISADLFLRFLAEKSSEVATEKKKKTVKVEHMRVAVKRHRPTNDFLFDSLPVPSPPPSTAQKSDSSAAVEKSLPFGTRRIDDFLRGKCAKETE
ncbi:hypothetical protein Scep_000911 [Stephania cephalantha]|uniref:Transcription factor CBF/NF-Y/archaeal histone domain-containing protein n=1 Tax=Stephania cephalantha TaxID=152367 RepID=A0AAP0L9P7_9MAGN